jgi:hypothetical protein
MYLSKKHGVLFIAVPRTASNSVQRVLLNSDLSDDVVHSLAGPQNTDAISAYHSTPSTLIAKGTLTADELSVYTNFGFVRDPLKRWVSSIFLARYTGVLDKTEDALTQICNLVRVGPSPRPFLNKAKPFTQPDYKPFAYKNFFFIGDQQVVDAYRWEDIEQVTNKIISDKLGQTVKTAFPHIQMNADGIPDAFRQPVADWLPADCYEKISAYFADDLAFYESVDFIAS